ncbi:MAG: ABC-2 family transporter protein [Candidatus Theseobacter exili]|nr:ABC-2 family transporter protein [Candidatus Theseobacter exili]
MSILMQQLRFSPMREYGSIVKMSLMRFAAYKADLVIHFFTYPVVFIAQFCFITAMFTQGLGQTGYTVSQLLTYYSMGWLLRMINHLGMDVSVSQTILSGSIANLLIKPVNHHHYVLSEALGKAAGRMLFYCTPAFLLLCLCVKKFEINLDINTLWFIVFAITGFMICFELQYFIGCTAFFITVNFQIAWILDMIIRLVSGLVVPISLFPKVMASLLEYLPFQYIYYVPIQIWLGKVPAEKMLSCLFVGFCWLFLLYFVNVLIRNAGLKKLAISGG